MGTPLGSTTYLSLKSSIVLLADISSPLKSPIDDNEAFEFNLNDWKFSRNTSHGRKTIKHNINRTSRLIQKCDAMQVVNIIPEPVLNIQCSNTVVSPSVDPSKDVNISALGPSATMKRLHTKTRQRRVSSIIYSQNDDIISTIRNELLLDTQHTEPFLFPCSEAENDISFISTRNFNNNQSAIRRSKTENEDVINEDVIQLFDNKSFGEGKTFEHTSSVLLPKPPQEPLTDKNFNRDSKQLNQPDNGVTSATSNLISGTENAIQSFEDFQRVTSLQMGNVNMSRGRKAYKRVEELVNDKVDNLKEVTSYEPKDIMAPLVENVILVSDEQEQKILDISFNTTSQLDRNVFTEKLSDITEDSYKNEHIIDHINVVQLQVITAPHENLKRGHLLEQLVPGYEVVLQQEDNLIRNIVNDQKELGSAHRDINENVKDEILPQHSRTMIEELKAFGTTHHDITETNFEYHQTRDSLSIIYIAAMSSHESITQPTVETLIAEKEQVTPPKHAMIDFNHIFNDIIDTSIPITVIRIENLAPIKMVDNQIGKFCIQDCYVILHVYQDPKIYSIYTWIPEESEIDKKFCSAMVKCN
jgi:hypothetical protein